MHEHKSEDCRLPPLSFLSGQSIAIATERGLTERVFLWTDPHSKQQKGIVIPKDPASCALIAIEIAEGIVTGIHTLQQLLQGSPDLKQLLQDAITEILVNFKTLIESELAQAFLAQNRLQLNIDSSVMRDRLESYIANKDPLTLNDAVNAANKVVRTAEHLSVAEGPALALGGSCWLAGLHAKVLATGTEGSKDDLKLTAKKLGEMATQFHDKAVQVNRARFSDLWYQGPGIDSGWVFRFDNIIVPSFQALPLDLPDPPGLGPYWYKDKDKAAKYREQLIAYEWHILEKQAVAPLYFAMNQWEQIEVGNFVGK